MIDNIRHRGLRRLYERGDKSRLRTDIADKAERFLTVLDQAETIEEVDLPGYGLHRLTGNLRGFGASRFQGTTALSSGFVTGMRLISIWLIIIRSGNDGHEKSGASGKNHQA
jgi:proteic killer suppression protein